MCCFSKSVLRKPSRLRVWPAKILPCRSSSPRRSSSGSELTIDCMMTVAMPVRSRTRGDPIGCNRLGEALAGQFAQLEQDAALAIHGNAKRFEDAHHLALPIAGFAEPANDADSRHCCALTGALHVRACRFSSHGRSLPRSRRCGYSSQAIAPLSVRRRSAARRYRPSPRTVRRNFGLAGSASIFFAAA